MKIYFIIKKLDNNLGLSCTELSTALASNTVFRDGLLLAYDMLC